MRRRPLVWIAGMAVSLLLLALAGALPPARTADLVSHPDPASSFADAMRRAALQQRADLSVAAPGGSTVVLTHGARTPRAVVLLHGFTNSPSQFERFAPLLFAAGDNVYVPRLPRHAQRHGTVVALGRLTAEELRRSADSAVDIAAGLGDSVIVVGLSAGGTMAAWIAQYRRVQRAVIIAPVLRLSRVPALLSDPLTNVALRLPNVSWSETPDPTEPDRELGVSTRAIAELLRLGQVVRETAHPLPPQAREIAFLMNAHDRTVATAPAVELARRWSMQGATVRVYRLPDSLKLRHDIVDSRQAWARPDVVYPAMEALAHGDAVPPILAGHRIWPSP